MIPYSGRALNMDQGGNLLLVCCGPGNQGAHQQLGRVLGRRRYQFTFRDIFAIKGGSMFGGTA
jgi:hypothetical protein